MRSNLAFLGILLLLVMVGCAQQEAETTDTTTMSGTSVPTTQPVQTTATTAPEAPATTNTAAPDTATAERRPVPDTHNVDHGGVMHATGSDNPTQRCASCHGQDLRGGKVAASSCYDCHEAVWEG